MTGFRKLGVRLSAFAGVLLFAPVAFAEGSGGSILAQGDASWMAIAIAVGIGLAAMGGTLSQGRLGAAGLEGIARNPACTEKLFVPMILGLAFIESLVLFTWVLMYLMLDKL